MMMETASSIQSFPSTRAYSTSFSAGKYSGKGIGSVKKEANEIEFYLIFPICTKGSFFIVYIFFTSGQCGRCKVV